MPRALEAGLKQYVILDFDKNKKPEEQPVIYTLSLNMRRSLMLGELLDNLGKSETTDELFNKVQSALSEIIYDWKNMKDPVTGQDIPYTKEAILDVFTFKEAYEVIRKVLEAQNVSEEDEKKSE